MKNKLIKKSVLMQKQLPYIVSSESIGKSLNSLCKWINNAKPDLLKNLYFHGAILLRGFDILDTKSFEAITKLFTSNFYSYQGGDSPRTKLTNFTYTSTHYPAEQIILQHNEKSFSSLYPKIIFFYCACYPKVGGETPLSDGRSILKRLPKSIISNFQKKKIKYIMNLYDKNNFGVGKSWQECYEIDSKPELENFLNKNKISYQWKSNNILCVYETVQPIIVHPITQEPVFFAQVNQWHPFNLDLATRDALYKILDEQDFYHYCCYGDETKINLKDLEEINRCIKEETKTFVWKQNDLLIVDNILTMHGRLPFKGERKILVAMGE